MSILPKPGIHAHRDLSCVHTHTHTTWQRWSSISMDKQLPPAEALHKDPKADNLGFIHWLPCQVLLYSLTSFIFLKESRIYWKVFPNEAEKLLYCWVRQGWEKLSSGSLRGTDSTSPSYYVWMTGPCLFLTCWAWSPCLHVSCACFLMLHLSISLLILTPGYGYVLGNQGTLSLDCGQEQTKTGLTKLFPSSNLELIWSFRVRGGAARRAHRQGGVWMAVMRGVTLLDQRQGRTSPWQE